MSELSLVQRLNKIATEQPELAETMNEAIKYVTRSGRGRADKTQLHRDIMKNNLDDAESMKTLTVPQDRDFTIALRAVDPDRALEIYQSMYDPEGKFLIAGCRVQRLDFHDMGAAYSTLRSRIGHVVNTSLNNINALLNEQTPST